MASELSDIIDKAIKRNRRCLSPTTPLCGLKKSVLEALFVGDGYICPIEAAMLICPFRIGAAIGKAYRILKEIEQGV